ncbi:trigger factor [Niabella drilacis]|uniref:Trigger factor n=1 Tax=Niabella drilacis (strain DSM 25811 / CCM 8410 / CCUG 62505 / LMG 26954 / E90) TaxID=1285928 RepID=A0A1G6LQX0_NIADE|nr:trigger factor [Niabella drilacis]SDC45688.1 trigger factor [Niabella drilacis]
MATITQEKIGPLHEKLSIKLDKTDYLPGFEKSLKEYSKKASIPGFRPGKVPAGLIKKMYGPSLFMDEVLRSVDKEVVNYLDTNKVNIFAQPLPLENDMSKLDVSNPSDYDFHFEIGLKPDFKMQDLAKLDITGYNIDITDEMVNEEVERLQNRYGNMTDKEAVDADDNVLNVTFTETDAAGNLVEDGIKKDNSLLVKYFAPAVRTALNGKKTGDSISIKLGEAFGEKELEFIAQDLGLDKEDAATRDKTFQLEITKVGLLEKKELNEEFFNQLYPAGDVKTEEDFKAKVKDEIYQYWAAQSRNQIHDQLFHKLVDDTKIEFPETFLKNWLTTQNSQPQEGEDQQPAKTPEQIEAEMPSFLNQLKWTLITEKIITDNSIQVAPDEIRNFAKQQLFQYMGGAMGMTEDQPWVNDYIERMMKDRKYVEDAYNRLQSQKVFEWAETRVKPKATSIKAEEFAKMVSEHQHHHH